MSCQFTIEGLPPSFNEHFKINYQFKQVYLSEEARLFKVKVKMSVPHMQIIDTDLFKLKVWFHHNWFFKNNKPRKLDLQNLDKLLIDALSERIGFDDSRIFECHYFKVQCLEGSKTVVEVSKLG